MKVLFICNSIPPRFGGAGHRTLRQATYLAKDGYDVGILPVLPHGGRLGEITLFTVPTVCRLRGGNRVRRIARAATIPYLMLWLWRTLRQFDPDIIHCIPANSRVALMGVALGRLQGRKVIVETTFVGSDDPVALRRRRAGVLKSRVFSMASAVVHISPLLQCIANRAGIRQERSCVIGNGVDVREFHAATSREREALRNKLGLGEGFIIINVAILRRRKGIGILMDTFTRVADRRADAKMVFVGPTDKDEDNRRFYEEVTTKVALAGLTDRIIFTGQVTNVNEWLKASDMFVSASEQEGFGTAVVEAMSTGLPVVVKNIPGVTDYIIDHGRDGLVVSDGRGMVKAWEELMGDAKLRADLGYHARVTVERRFAETVVMRQYTDLYHRLLQG